MGSVKKGFAFNREFEDFKNHNLF